MPDPDKLRPGAISDDHRAVLGPRWSVRPRSGPALPGGHSSTARTWADALFAAMVPGLSAQAFRALAKVLHPDTGDLMRQLVDAHERVTGRAAG